ncbi:DUF488 family protein [Sphingosinicella sp.]|uniref:DUF488 domain-containing protein n=1 Tax=Sphingosinicella sp. TaxID=1917971 RepID=UPI002604FD10|nr:DUF488 domain-containing protein [Sphingosinicella sp.]
MLATIGYERATLADFIATLRLSKVQILVDVRERAQSRRPGFSKTSLSLALSEAGIEYLHFPELGDPKEGREAARAGKMSLFLKIYREAISKPEAKSALIEIEKLASEKAICLMCFERDQNECHRRIVAEKLETRLGVKAAHWGVIEGASNGGNYRRMLYPHKGAAAQI